MDRATSFDCENISGNLPTEMEVELKENDDLTNVECNVGNLEFKRVWEMEKVDMRFVNQFLNQLNIHNLPHQQTASNLTAMLSSSFPSDDETLSSDEIEVDEEIAFGHQFVSSTPHAKDSKEFGRWANTESDVKAFQEFNKASPIHKTPQRKSRGLTKRRLQFSFEFEEFPAEQNFKVIKL